MEESILKGTREMLNKWDPFLFKFIDHNLENTEKSGSKTPNSFTTQMKPQRAFEVIFPVSSQGSVRFPLSVLSGILSIKFKSNISLCFIYLLVYWGGGDLGTHVQGVHVAVGGQLSEAVTSLFLPGQPWGWPRPLHFPHPVHWASWLSFACSPSLFLSISLPKR